MPRAARPRIADLTRAIKAFARAGERAEIRIEPDGTIRIMPADHKPTQPPPAEKRKIVL